MWKLNYYHDPNLQAVIIMSAKKKKRSNQNKIDDEHAKRP